MNWRIAIPNDYEEYERLYNDLDCETLYRGKEESEINPQEKEIALRYFYMDEETKKHLEDWNKRTYEKFIADLNNTYVKIYVCIDKKRCVGFAELYQHYKTKWKLGYLCLEPEYQTTEVIGEMIKYLKDSCKIKIIDVSTLGGKINDMLESNGFQSTGSKYYFRKI